EDLSARCHARRLGNRLDIHDRNALAVLSRPFPDAVLRHGRDAVSDHLREPRPRLVALERDRIEPPRPRLSFTARTDDEGAAVVRIREGADVFADGAWM